MSPMGIVFRYCSLEREDRVHAIFLYKNRFLHAQAYFSAETYFSADLRLNIFMTFLRFSFFILFYYMANPVLGKSLCSDWFFLGQDFAVRTVSMETAQSVYFCFGAKPANSTFATKTAKKKCENCHSSH